MPEHSQEGMFKRLAGALRRRHTVNLFWFVPAPYREAVEFAVGVQAVLLFLAAMILDGGRLLAYGLVLSGAWFAGAVCIMLRRPKAPGRFDLAYVKYGFFINVPLFVIAGLALDFLFHPSSPLKR